MNQNLREDAMMEEAIASAEISMNTPDTELQLHMKALAKAECAKDAGEFTVVRLGYVISLMKEVQDERDTYWKERVRKEVEGMPAFTCCSDKCMGKVSDEAKKPMWGTNYLEREALLQALDNLK